MKYTFMKNLELRKLVVFLIVGLTVILFSSCKKDPVFVATVTFTEIGDSLNGDAVGDGGSTQQSFKWNNSLTTVDWSMDITTSNGGSFTLRISDANGTVVLDESLVKGIGDDSKSGVSAAGTVGEWTVTVILSDFDGDGSFSISPGN